MCHQRCSVHTFLDTPTTHSSTLVLYVSKMFVTLYICNSDTVIMDCSYIAVTSSELLETFYKLVYSCVCLFKGAH